MSDKSISRRSFLAGSLAATAFTIVPRHVLGGSGNVAPSEKITHAVIGVGGMGRGHVGYALGDKGGRLVAVCDVDEQHIARAQGLAAQHPWETA